MVTYAGGRRVKNTGAITAEGFLNADGKKIYSVMNNSADVVYFGIDNTVTTSTGFPIPQYTEILINCPIYLVSDGTIDVRWAELAVSS